MFPDTNTMALVLSLYVILCMFGASHHQETREYFSWIISGADPQLGGGGGYKDSPICLPLNKNVS